MTSTPSDPASGTAGSPGISGPPGTPAVSSAAVSTPAPSAPTPSLGPTPTPGDSPSPPAVSPIGSGVVGIAVEHLSKSFGPVRAVDDLSFTARPGRVTAFLGPNGAGKTTTLRMLLGLVTPTSGRSLVAGRPYRQLPRPSRTVGAVLEAGGFHPARRARGHLGCLCTASGLPRVRSLEVLRLVGLEGVAERPVGGFSMGMRQRLALAAALLGDPSVLVLDEPGNGLDPEGLQWLRGFLRFLAAEGRTVLVSSHQLDEVDRIADDVVIIAGGRLLVEGSLAELTRRRHPGVRLRSPAAAHLARMLSQAGIAARQLAGDRVEAEGASADQVGQVIARHGIVIHEMVPIEGSLESIFLELTAGSDPAGSSLSGLGNRPGTT